MNFRSIKGRYLIPIPWGVNLADTLFSTSGVGLAEAMPVGCVCYPSLKGVLKRNFLVARGLGRGLVVL